MTLTEIWEATGVKLIRAVLVAALLAGPALPAARAECTAACDAQQRVAAADAYLSTRPGTVGYVLRDRKTGAVYRNSHAGDMVWTASTIKLGIVVDLFARQSAGLLRLTDNDIALMGKMLHTSDNDAADTLWTRYGGPDHTIFNNDFPHFGMTRVQPQRGFGDMFPYWGFQKSTTDDLDQMVNYMLTRLRPNETAWIVSAMQNVDPIQQWGVWGAGPNMAPGNKDGWSDEQGGWVTNTVGFAGPGQRFTLAVMNALNGAGGNADGQATTTRLSQILLAGRQ
ncbi:class A beta-lactamase-related serine hydrolase [Mycolicibacterium llatzerense]|uniref:class A beta-lactamase-related serine hydrolase n=1 Tax=Mycolicibacterium llatzerense TaxID=280871 RepID=UPI0021B5F883|nr:class A beta-lactamase-related serine hydrolase [Mycolicibacterium llatzerense]